MNEYLPLFVLAGLGLPMASPPIEEKRSGFGRCKRSQGGITKPKVRHHSAANRLKNKLRRQAIRRARKMAA